MKTLCLILSFGVLTPSFVPSAFAQSIRLGARNEQKDLALDWLVDKEGLWAMSPDELEKTAGSSRFEWQDKERTRARFDPERFKYTVKGVKVGEVLLNFKDGKLAAATVSVLNKGDEEDVISKTEFTEAVNSLTAMMNANSGVKPEPRRKEEVLSKYAEGMVWRSKKGLFVGEWLFLPAKKEEVDGWIITYKEHGEYVRLRMYPPQAQLGSQTAKIQIKTSRGELAKRVKREGTRVFLDGVPMVNQGSKGYCAVASFERVLRYYGADIDMHDLANAAETYGGTEPGKMKSAVFKVSQKLGISTREPFFLKSKQYESMFKEYNKVAAKEGKSTINLETDGWDEVDPPTLVKSRTLSPDYTRFRTEVAGSINKGIPLMWALRLGLFWEDKLEESYEANRYAVTKDKAEGEEEESEFEKKYAEMRKKEMEELRKKPRPPAYMGGGHMRLIVGYDAAKKTILYTDSWGPGHELKEMPIEQAFAITSALFIAEPR
jgi:hypothetical protein